MRQFSLIVLIGILLFGAARLTLNLESYADLWVDEGWSVAATDGPTPIEVTESVAKDVHPPLYFYLLYVWRIFTGDGLFAMRYLAVLVTLVAAAMTYRLGAGLFNRQAGMLAAALYLLHDLVWVLGREIRQYPFLQLTALLTVYAYWCFWQHPTRRNGIFFVLSGAALLWTNYWGGFVLLALALHTLFTRYRQIRSFIIAYVAIGVAFIPWLPVLIQQVTQDIPEGIGHALPASQTGYEVLAFQLFGRPELLWLLLALIGGLRLMHGQDKTNWYRWLPSSTSMLPLLVFVLPVVISIAINLFYASLSFRTLSVVIPLMVVLIGHTIASFRLYERLLLTGIVLVLAFSLTAAQPPIRLPWQPVAEFVAQHSDGNDVVLIETWFDTYAYEYYLDNVGMPAIATELQRRERSNQDFNAFLGDALSDYDGLWMTRFSSDADISERLLGNGFIRTGTVIQQTDLAPIELWRFDRVEALGIFESFGDMLNLHDYDASQRSDTLAVTLLWSSVESPDTDYVMSVFLLDENGVLVAQDDSPPMDNTAPTSGWQPGQVVFDAHPLPIGDLAPGVYQLGLRVYSFIDSTFTETQILPPASCVDIDPCDFVTLETVTIEDD